MPLLEITQIRHINASIRLTNTTAILVDQYAAFVGANADDVVEEALKHVFTKDRDFQEFLRTPKAQTILPTLRVRKPTASEPGSESGRKPVSGVESEETLRAARA